MPLPAPKPVDALRQHTRAVMLISADGDASSALLDAIRDSEVPCELIGHPVVAMAELVRLERDNREGHDRTALFVADDERIDQLSSLFQAVRTRLPQVAIWVIAGEFAVLTTGARLHADRHELVAAELPVDLEDELHLGLLEQLRVVNRPSGGEDGPGSAEPAPKLLRDVRSVRRNKNCQLLKDCVLVAFQIGEFIYTNHKIAHRCVERKPFDVFCYFFYQLMKRLEFFAIGFIINN